MRAKSTLIVVTVLLSLVGSPLSLAQTADQSALLAELQNQINALKAKIADLQSQLGAAREEVKHVRSELRELHITRSLYRGSRGDDVTALQLYLAQFPDLYPEALITGFFGELTERAVKRFQKKHGIEQAGIVGPKTRGRLAVVFLDQSGATTTVLLPPGIAKKRGDRAHRADDDDADETNGEDDDRDDDHKRKGHGRGGGNVATTTPSATSTPPRATTTPPSHKLTVCHKGKNTITIAISAWNAHHTHGDTIGACVTDDDEDDEDGDDDGAATTTPDTTAPAITGLTATSTASTTATIVWHTNEPATSKILFGTSTPVTNANSSTVSSGTLVVAHSLALPGLTASTTYYMLAVSRDAAGNSATSTELSFTTLRE